MKVIPKTIDIFVLSVDSTIPTALSPRFPRFFPLSFSMGRFPDTSDIKWKLVLSDLGWKETQKS